MPHPIVDQSNEIISKMLTEWPDYNSELQTKTTGKKGLSEFNRNLSPMNLFMDIVYL